LRAEWWRLTIGMTFTCLTLSCARKAPVAEQRSSPMRIPDYIAGAPAGVACGADRTGLSDSLTSVVDVVIDSLFDGGLSQLQLAFSFAPKAEHGLIRPNISAGIVYPVEGRPNPREVMGGCPWFEGITLRVNAAGVSRAGLSVSASGPVRIAVRTVNGVLLATPLVVTPGSVPAIIRWRARLRSS
jgi:hypothetical protein